MRPKASVSRARRSEKARPGCVRRRREGTRFPAERAGSFALRFVLRKFLTRGNYGRATGDERKTFRAMVCKAGARGEPVARRAACKVKTFSPGVSGRTLPEAGPVFPLWPASICNFITRDDLRSRSPEKNLSRSLPRLLD